MNGLRLLDVVLAGVPVGRSMDPRRCIVVGLPASGKVLLVPCSSQLDLFHPERDFLFSQDAPDFPTAGFSKTAYAIDGRILSVDRTAVRKRYGRLTGDLAQQFSEWLE